MQVSIGTPKLGKSLRAFGQVGVHLEVLFAAWVSHFCIVTYCSQEGIQSSNEFTVNSFCLLNSGVSYLYITSSLNSTVIYEEVMEKWAEGKRVRSKAHIEVPGNVQDSLESGFKLMNPILILYLQIYSGSFRIWECENFTLCGKIECFLDYGES